MSGAPCNHPVAHHRHSSTPKSPKAGTRENVVVWGSAQREECGGCVCVCVCARLPTYHHHHQVCQASATPPIRHTPASDSLPNPTISAETPPQDSASPAVVSLPSSSSPSPSPSSSSSSVPAPAPAAYPTNQKIKYIKKIKLIVLEILKEYL